MNTIFSSESDGRNTRWNEHRAQRREELIRQARKAVHNLGPDASMEEIATFVGTSKSVFYRYFEDKKGLQQAVGDSGIRIMEAEILKAAEGKISPNEALEAMIRVYLEQAAFSPNIYTFATRQSLQQVSKFEDRFSDFLRTNLNDIAKYMPDVIDKTLLEYWPVAASGFLRSAGEKWLHEDVNTRPSSEKMAFYLARWLTQGFHTSTPGKIADIV